MPTCTAVQLHTHSLQVQEFTQTFQCWAMRQNVRLLMTRSFSLELTADNDLQTAKKVFNNKAACSQLACIKSQMPYQSTNRQSQPHHSYRHNDMFYVHYDLHAQMLQRYSCHLRPKITCWSTLQAYARLTCVNSASIVECLTMPTVAGQQSWKAA